MSAGLIVYLFALHFVADFLLQSREMGKNKSSNWKYLGEHLAIQYGVMLFGLIPWAEAHGFYTIFAFAVLNALIHGIIDKNIWNLYKLSVHYRLIRDFKKSGEKSMEDYYNKAVANWKYWDDHWFYSTIGFDQFLHGTTLVVLARYLF